MGPSCVGVGLGVRGDPRGHPVWVGFGVRGDPRGRPVWVGLEARGDPRAVLCADVAGDHGPGAQHCVAEAGHQGQGGASEGGPDPPLPAFPPAQCGAVPRRCPVQVLWPRGPPWAGPVTLHHTGIVHPPPGLLSLWGPLEHPPTHSPANVKRKDAGPHLAPHTGLPRPFSCPSTTGHCMSLWGTPCGSPSARAGHTPHFTLVWNLGVWEAEVPETHGHPDHLSWPSTPLTSWWTHTPLQPGFWVSPGAFGDPSTAERIE